MYRNSPLKMTTEHTEHELKAHMDTQHTSHDYTAHINISPTYLWFPSMFPLANHDVGMLLWFKVCEA